MDTNLALLLLLDFVYLDVATFPVLPSESLSASRWEVAFLAAALLATDLALLLPLDFVLLDVVTFSMSVPWMSDAVSAGFRAALVIASVSLSLYGFYSRGRTGTRDRRLRLGPGSVIGRG
ncbi:uncharacterized protein IUM83_04397 [Phytophthora cinnamomi]|uniref:uncharacterized protein n=1 Tax=Phytophthora cinnamomi TaxID=4785 RepID=UPI003559721B|nr:hypothetical protein IUM83_04397 [Phytophthora cinnamomi]